MLLTISRLALRGIPSGSTSSLRRRANIPHRLCDKAEAESSREPDALPAIEAGKLDADEQADQPKLEVAAIHSVEKLAILLCGHLSLLRNTRYLCDLL